MQSLRGRVGAFEQSKRVVAYPAAAYLFAGKTGALKMGPGPFVAALEERVAAYSTVACLIVEEIEVGKMGSEQLVAGWQGDIVA